MIYLCPFLLPGRQVQEGARQGRALPPGGAGPPGRGGEGGQGAEGQAEVERGREGEGPQEAGVLAGGEGQELQEGAGTCCMLCLYIR